MFADDLVIFCNSRESSILAVKIDVDEFLKCSGLGVNSQISQVFAGGMIDEKKVWVERVFGCSCRPLTVKYLGMPLNSKGLRAHECTELTLRITKRLNSWRNRFLSRACRRSLVIYVLQSMAYYWARIYILAKKVIAAVNSICANLLWKGKSTCKGGRLVKWEGVCMEKEEGGLGIKDLAHMNDAMVLNQLWCLENNVLNVWNLWVAAYWTKNRKRWDDGELSKSSWVLKRMGERKKMSSKCVVMEENSLKWIGQGNGFHCQGYIQFTGARKSEGRMV